MEKEIAYREIQRFRTIDGRIVERLTKRGTVKVDVDEKVKEDDLPDDVYVGVFPIFNPYSGVVEQRFSLDDPKTIEEAFQRYVPKAMQLKEEYEKRSQQAKEESEKKIVTAPAQALNQIEKPKEQTAE